MLIISTCEVSCYCTSSMYELTNFYCRNNFSLAGSINYLSFDESEAVVSISRVDEALKRFLLTTCSSKSKPHSSILALCLDRLLSIRLLSVSNPP
jgi:hypothetical protein